MERSRPLSPHLGIYKKQITSVLSIFHRMSGVLVYIGFLALVWWLVYMVYGSNPRESLVFQCATSDIGKVIVIAWSYAFFFHLATGIRHLVWDSGCGFGINAVAKSGWIAVILSLLLFGASWVLILCI